jgi:hypothetical protein
MSVDTITSITAQEWAAIDSLRARGYAVSVFAPHELDGVDYRLAQVEMLRAVYGLVRVAGNAAQARDAAQAAVNSLTHS